LLFSAIIETFFLSINEEIIESRLIAPVDKFINLYYIGDGIYGDGLRFHFDYYNSFVIHPMLTDILEVVTKSQLGDFDKAYSIQRLRHQRYAEILERMISPTGTWPVVGRTLSCKIGVFHALSHAVYKQLLSDDLKPAQVRCALNSVLLTFLSNSNNFDSNGFLTVGLNGEQRDIAEEYISAGSSYHTVTFFATLGLSASDDFWMAEDREWSSLLAFDGKRLYPDTAYIEKNNTKVIILKLLKILRSRLW